MAREAREAKAQLESERAMGGLDWSVPRTARHEARHEAMLSDYEEDGSDPTCSVPRNFTAECAAATKAASAAEAAEAAEWARHSGADADVVAREEDAARRAEGARHAEGAAATVAGEPAAADGAVDVA
mmetsp:Transcript_12709/g.33319  ORF Transcript_12709/g.33319 Transcript_12709/m.33319 type:complete len:128 (+) Transcript_12709:1328-1711(+)